VREGGRERVEGREGERESVCVCVCGHARALGLLYMAAGGYMLLFGVYPV
jgi:hypothetical protein